MSFIGKCQTENAILNAKLLSRKQQSDLRYEELNHQYNQIKSHYEHVSSCVQEFQTKLYQRKGVCKIEMKDKDEQHNSSDDIIEVIIENDGMTS